MIAPHAFLTRTRTERRALQIVNEATSWPELYGLGESARREWLETLDNPVASLSVLDDALRALQVTARLDVDRSQFVSGWNEGSEIEIERALLAVDQAASAAASDWTQK